VSCRKSPWAVATAAGIALSTLAAFGAAAAPPRIPIPAERVASLAARLGAAVNALQAGDCGTWLGFQRSVRARTTVPCDDATRARLAGWRATRVARYGTGAVITYVSAGHPRGVTASYLLGPGRRYLAVDSLDPDRTPGVFGGSTSSGPYRVALASVLSALRHHNCNLFWVRAILFRNARPWTNYGGAGARTRSVACRAVFGPPPSALVRDLVANPDALPIHFGGTQDWHFFGLRTPLHYYNFVVAHYADQAGSRTKYFVDPPVRVF
jgi:hypothetical protein